LKKIDEVAAHKVLKCDHEIRARSSVTRKVAVYSDDNIDDEKS
jgi:hypothetical protein